MPELCKLIKPQHLPCLKELHIEGLAEEHCFNYFLGSGYPRLEKMDIVNSHLSSDNVKTLISLLANGCFPELKYLRLTWKPLDYLHLQAQENKENNEAALPSDDLDLLPQSQHLMLKELHLTTLIPKLADFLKFSFPELEKVSITLAKLQIHGYEKLLRVMMNGSFPKLKSVDLLDSCVTDLLPIHVHVKIPNATEHNTHSPHMIGDSVLSSLDSSVVMTQLLGTKFSTLKEKIQHVTCLRETDTEGLTDMVLLECPQELDFRGNPVDRFMDDTISYRTRKVIMTNTKLNTDDVAALSRIFAPKILETVDLSTNTLKDHLPILLVHPHNLRSLNLEDTKLGNNAIIALGKADLRGLVTLNLSKNNLKDTLYYLLNGECFHLCEFKQLKELVLEDTELSTNDIQTLGNADLRGLVTLKLSKNTLTGTLHYLFNGELCRPRGFKKLKELVLEDTKLSPTDVVYLPHYLERRGLPEIIKSFKKHSD